MHNGPVKDKGEGICGTHQFDEKEHDTEREGTQHYEQNSDDRMLFVFVGVDARSFMNVCGLLDSSVVGFSLFRRHFGMNLKERSSSVAAKIIFVDAMDCV